MSSLALEPADRPFGDHLTGRGGEVLEMRAADMGPYSQATTEATKSIVAMFLDAQRVRLRELSLSVSSENFEKKSDSKT